MLQCITPALNRETKLKIKIKTSYSDQILEPKYQDRNLDRVTEHSVYSRLKEEKKSLRTAVEERKKKPTKAKEKE